MGIYYLDTSAVAKRYIQETGSTWIRTVADPAAGHTLYLARITDVELTSALVRRRGQRGLSDRHAAAVLGQFRTHLDQDYRTVEITIDILKRASSLAEKHALRGYDSVQLSVALAVFTLFSALILVSADAELNSAAISEGMAVENPDDHR